MKALRILVVDDDELLLDSLRGALEGEGHHVVTANGGQAGIETFRSVHKSAAAFDVVITDLGMPGVDGRQVVEFIRRTQPGLPIVLLTGWGQHISAENEQPPDVDILLEKPPRMRELRVALADLTTPAR